MTEKVKEKDAIATSLISWAAEQFGFVWGDSSLAQRLKALEVLVGSQAEVIRLSALSPSTYKSVLARQGDMASDRIGALAKGAGLSLNYLVYGRPELERDVACEEHRFDLAVTAFPVPSSAEKREARLSLIAGARDDLDRRMAMMMDYNHSVPSLTDETAPAPLALSLRWLVHEGLSAGTTRHLLIIGDEGGPRFPRGSVVLIDTAQVTPDAGPLYAMNIGGDVQLRRLVYRLNGELELVHVQTGWPSETVASGDLAPILGKVVGALSTV